MLRTYPKVEKYLLQTYAIDNVIAETDASLTRYIQPLTMSPTQYAESFVASSLRCVEFYNEYFLKRIFIESLHEAVCRSMRSCWITHSASALYDLARHATLL